MTVWPFSRNGGRKRPRSGATLSDLEAPGVIAEAPHASGAAVSGWAQTSMPSADPPVLDALSRPTQKKRRTSANHPPPQNNKLHRRPRVDSLSSDRQEPLRMASGASRRRGSRSAGAGNPQSGADTTMRTDEDDLQRAPTLHGRRNSTAARRKSSRRTRTSADRDADTRATSNPTPTRPAAEAWQSGRPMKKDSKRGRSGFGFGRSWEHSDISLPTPDSIHSSLSSDAEAGFKVSALDSLAPRPTLQYTHPVNYCAPSRRPSQRKRFNIPPEVLKAHKRIDSLADDFDASDLREVMEREKKRREKKQQREREKMEARLAKRAVVQREAEERAEQSGTSPPINMERGVIGRELGGRDSPSAVWVDQRRYSDVSMDDVPLPPLVAEKEELRRSIEEQLERHPVEQLLAEDDAPQMIEHAQPASRAHPPLPELVIEERPFEEVLPADQQQQMLTPPHSPINELRREQSASRSSMGSETGKFTVVKLPRPEAPKAPLSPEEPQRKKSRKLSLSTFFKWPGKSKASTPTSSFSNTSREEMMATAAQLQAQSQSRALSKKSQDTIVPVRRVASGAPKRTRSRFREDLPELPMSPPSSRLQSPDAYNDEDAPTPLTAERTSHDYLSVQHTPRYDTPTSEHHTLETMRNTPVSWGRRAGTPPLAMSLGSIDSEASWLSGRARKSPVSRTVSRTVSRATHHQSLNYSHASLTDSFEDPMPDDEYMSQLSPLSHNTITNRDSMDEGHVSSDDEDARTEVGDAKWGAVEAQHTRVVSAHDLRTIRSHEGMFNSFEQGQQAELGDADDDSNIRNSIVSIGSETLQRARSVQLGRGRVKHISIASTKLHDGASQDRAEEEQIEDRRRSTGNLLL